MKHLEINPNELYTIVWSDGDSTQSYEVRGRDLNEAEVALMIATKKNKDGRF